MARAFGGALVLLGAGGVIVAAVELALFWPVEGPLWLYSLFPLTGLIYLAAGLVAWWRRPSNRIGVIIALTGGMWLAAALINTDIAALVAVGSVLATVPLAAAVWLLHAFPSGRLRSAVSVATVVAALVVSLALQAPQYLFGPPGSGEVLSIAGGWPSSPSASTCSGSPAPRSCWSPRGYCCRGCGSRRPGSVACSPRCTPTASWPSWWSRSGRWSSSPPSACPSWS